MNESIILTVCTILPNSKYACFTNISTGTTQHSHLLNTGNTSTWIFNLGTGQTGIAMQAALPTCTLMTTKTTNNNRNLVVILDDLGAGVSSMSG